MEEIITGIEQRAKSFNRQGRTILFFILLIVMAAIGVFTYASEISIGTSSKNDIRLDYYVNNQTLLQAEATRIELRENLRLNSIEILDNMQKKGSYANFSVDDFFTCYVWPDLYWNNDLKKLIENKLIGQEFVLKEINILVSSEFGWSFTGRIYSTKNLLIAQSQCNLKNSNRIPSYLTELNPSKVKDFSIRYKDIKPSKTKDEIDILTQQIIYNLPNIFKVFVERETTKELVANLTRYDNINNLIDETKLKNTQLARQVIDEYNILPNETQIQAIKDIKNGQNNQSLNLIDGYLTRFGGSILLLSLAGVLLPQYRYSMKMAGFYFAQTDAIKIAMVGTIDKDTLTSLVRELSPNVDFGSSKLPSDDIMKLAQLAKKNNG